MLSLLLKPPFLMWNMKVNANTHDLAYSVSENVTIAVDPWYVAAFGRDERTIRTWGL